VLDISLDKNREDLERVLQAGAQVWYCDHHYAGDIPQYARLSAHSNTEPTVCTSSLVNGFLQGAFRAWAVVGSFGDNLREAALALARPLGLDESALQQLEQLGIYINYNGYGSGLDELHFHPAALYRELRPYAEPAAFMADNRQTFERLQTGYEQDLSAARNLSPEHADEHVAVYLLPDAPWSRRVSGVYGNLLANEHPQRAHAVVSVRPDGDLLISVRAPLSNRVGADTLCRQFPTGGGRAAAAGINALPAQQLPDFVDSFRRFYAQA
jgi:hypothetical protein